jgi:hypothetical protein
MAERIQFHHALTVGGQPSRDDWRQLREAASAALEQRGEAPADPEWLLAFRGQAVRSPQARGTCPRRHISTGISSKCFVNPLGILAGRTVQS